MTRTEIVEELKRRGVSFRMTMKTAELEAMLEAERAKSVPLFADCGGVVLNQDMTVAERDGTPPALEFSGGGWCEEAGMSYFRGRYQPRTWAEYEALRKYAEKR